MRIAEYRAKRVAGDDITKHLRDDFLIHGWFDCGETIMVFGPSGTAKTFLLIDVCLYLAAALPWHGAPVLAADRTGAIVYVISEGRREGFENCCTAWFETHPEAAKQARGRFYAIAMRSDFCGSDDASCLAELLADLGPISLIVIDTMAANMGNGDESLARDISRIFASVDDLRSQTGAAVALVHHTGKNAAMGARGSSNIRAGLDVSVEVVADGETIRATCDKQRERAGGLSFAFRLQPHLLGTTPERNFEVTTCTIVPLTEQEAKAARARNAEAKLPTQSKQALEALREVADQIDRRGDPERFPINRRIVLAPEWKEGFDRWAYHGEEVKPHTRTTAFNRARDTLLERKLVAQYDGFFWCVDPTA